MAKPTFSKAFASESVQVQKFQEIKPSCYLLIDLKKNGSTGNVTGAPTKI